MNQHGDDVADGQRRQVVAVVGLANGHEPGRWDIGAPVDNRRPQRRRRQQQCYDEPMIVAADADTGRVGRHGVADDSKSVVVVDGVVGDGGVDDGVAVATVVGPRHDFGPTEPSVCWNCR